MVVALVPAAGVVSLDVVGVAPTWPVVPRQPLEVSVDAPAQGRPVVEELREYAEETTHESEVPVAPVDPVVREVALTPKKTAAPRPRHRTRTSPRPPRPSRPMQSPGRTRVVSEPQAVTGYGAVGVTWEPGEPVADDDIAVQVRTQKDGAWSGWSDVDYHEDHGPDPDSDEAQHARPGTDGSLVGDVDQVQVRVESTDAAAPGDMKLAVIDPGQAPPRQAPAIDTRDAAPPTATVEPTTEHRAGRGARRAAGGNRPSVAGEAVAPRRHVHPEAEDLLARASGAPTSGCGTAVAALLRGARPASCTTPSTPTTTRASEVPGDPARHLRVPHQSRGWSDIGYNFLVDRFGRIWEGRYGGVDRPVVGAHTLGYNDNAFAMSAIGNFETAPAVAGDAPRRTARCSRGSCRCTASTAASTRQWVSKQNFKAINGHRDAASTACPGRYLYAKIPQIRSWRPQLQQGLERAAARVRPRRQRPPRPASCAAVSDGMAFVLPIEPTAAGVQGRASRSRPGSASRRIAGLLQRRRLGPRRLQRPDLPQSRTVRSTSSRGVGTGKFAPAQRARLRLRRRPAAGRGR